MSLQVSLPQPLCFFAYTVERYSRSGYEWPGKNKVFFWGRFCSRRLLTIWLLRTHRTYRRTGQMTSTKQRSKNGLCADQKFSKITHSRLAVVDELSYLLVCAGCLRPLAHSWPLMIPFHFFLQEQKVFQDNVTLRRGQVRQLDGFDDIHGVDLFHFLLNSYNGTVPP